MPESLFFSCAVRRDLRDIAPAENQVAIDSVALSDFSTDYLRSALADHATVPGEFVECKADTKRCKVTYNTRKPDQWLTVLKPNKGSSWELTGYGLYSTSEESSEGSNDEDFSDE